MSLLGYIVIVLVLAIAVLYICNKLRIPTIVGFLFTGIIAGPHGLSLINAEHEVEMLADFGIVLLLFTIGIEFSFKKLLRIRRDVLLTGTLQVLFTSFIVYLFSRIFEFGWRESLFVGFIVSLSSTAIVLKLLQERGEIDSPYGRITLAVLIFQDIVSVPLMLLTPVLAGDGNNSSDPLLIIAQVLGVIIFMIVASKYLVPVILFQIAKTRSREIFLFSIVFICLSSAYLTSIIGLSLSLGAFIAGLIISESEYSHHALGNIQPFRDLFTSFFFISIGMLLDLKFIIQKPIIIFLIVLAVLLIKILSSFIVAMLSGLSLRTTILFGFAICQVGEFSFVLSRAGVESGLLSESNYQYFLSVSVVTMILTPFIIQASSRISDFFIKLPLPDIIKAGFYKHQQTITSTDKLKDHMIIIGFGIVGRNVARAAKVAGIPYIIIEMNPETVKTEQKRNESIFYGDAFEDAVLEYAFIKEARIVVITIPDPIATRHIIVNARKINSKIYIIARTRFFQEMKELKELGVDEVIPEEFETSIEIFTRVLVKYLIPKDEIERFITEVRNDGYNLFRNVTIETNRISTLKEYIPDVEVSTLKVSKNSMFTDRTLSEIDMRKKYDITVLAIKRDSQIIANPAGEDRVYNNDILLLLGKPDKIYNLIELFKKEK